MFGAYQAGVWQGLDGWFRPDIVVGASIGGLNGWAIAGGCPGDELAGRWLNLGELCRWRLRLPRSPLDGIFDCAAFEALVRGMYADYRPSARFGIVVTDVLKMRPRLMTTDITWEHLAASCAVPFLFPQRRIGGRLYSDGGLVQSLPVWAAVEMGATRVLAIQVMPEMQSPAIRTLVKAFRRAAVRPQAPEQSVKVMTLNAGLPGRACDLLHWKRHLAVEWLEQGREQILMKKQSLQQMFWE